MFEIGKGARWEEGGVRGAGGGRRGNGMDSVPGLSCTHRVGLWHAMAAEGVAEWVKSAVVMSGEVDRQVPWVGGGVQRVWERPIGWVPDAKLSFH